MGIVGIEIPSELANRMERLMPGEYVVIVIPPASRRFVAIEEEEFLRLLELANAKRVKISGSDNSEG